MQQLVVFSLGSEEYGLPISKVQEVIRYARPRLVPSAPPCVRGVIDLRGTVVPVCDLTQRLGLPSATGTEAKILIVEAGTVMAGLVVDRIAEVLTIDEERLETPWSAPRAFASRATIGDRKLVLLDPSALFEQDDVEAAQVVAA